MSPTRILVQTKRFMFLPMARLASQRRRAELAYFHRRLDEFAAGVDKRFAAMQQEFYAKLKRLQVRVEEAERRNKLLSLRVQALERELHKLPSIHVHGAFPDSKIGMA
jgi:hypothetical protein